VRPPASDWSCPEKVQRQKTAPLFGSYACLIVFLIDEFDLGEAKLQQRRRE
jgi:hypothetical protein